ncbi:hypothetical protein F5887DRAFT_960853 [Amanita rubescens]|nr:hypothetical protein F5887DRAFT_960853 [Amanita rubescens]
MHSKATDLFFERLFAIANTSKLADGVALSIIEELKRRVEAEEKECIRKAPKEFTLDEAVLDFDLAYSRALEDQWKIEVLPDVKTFQPSACLVSLLENYTEIYDRSSKTACRFAVDFLLCECIAAIRDEVSGISATQSTDVGRRTPTPWDTVKVHCDVSFTHKMETTPKTVVYGRVDYGVGIRSNRLFYSLLLCVEANFHGNLDNVLTQLVVYLACLRQSRVNGGRSDTSVHGVATDGLSYVFVTITDEGVLKQSRLLNVIHGDLSTVLGCFQYVLEMAMPNGDDPIDLDDNPYLYYNESTTNNEVELR